MPLGMCAKFAPLIACVAIKQSCAWALPFARLSPNLKITSQFLARLLKDYGH